MKKITLLLTLLTISFGFSQTNLEDFEGTAPSTIDDAGITSSVQADPATPSEKALELITSASGQPWQGAKLLMQNNKIDMTTSNKVMTVDIYSNSPKEFLAKLSDGDVGGTDTAQESKTAAAHTGSGWETLSFDFNVAADTSQPGYNPPNDQFSSIVFFPLYDISNNGWCDGCGENNALVTTTNVDNVTAIAGDAIVPDLCTNGVQDGDETGVDCGGTSCGPCAAPPTVAAPTPPARDAADVISIYSDAYTDVTIDDFDFGLCDGGVPNLAVSEETIGGNLTQHYLGSGCQGIDMQNNRIDASEFTKLHFDFYTDDAIDGAVFNIKLVDWAGNATEAGGTGLEVNFNAGTSPALITGSWVSVDVDITSIGGMVGGNLTRSDIAQIHITSNLPNAWYDNLYIYDKITPGTCSDGVQNQDETGIDCGGTISGCAPCSGPPTVAAPTPPARNATDVISFYSGAYTDITIDNFDFGLCDGGVPNLAVSEVMIAGNPTQNYLGSGCQGISIETNRIDASAFTNIHFDFFTDVSGVDLIGKVFNIKLVDWAGNATEAGATGLEVNFNDGTSPAIIASSWVSVDIDITSLGGMVGGNLTRSDIAQIHITSNLPNAWYDNLYLYKDGVLGTTDIEFTELKVYPNPSSNSWNFVSAQETITDISIYDVLGKQVKNIQPKSLQATIDISDLSSGIYFARLASSSDNAKSTVKLIKL